MRRLALAVDERDFRRLWVGDLVSQIGSQITVFALPFMAVAVLDASGGQIGVLQALYTLPFLLVPLPVGVWLERRVLRPVLVTLNLVCAALVLSVPVAAAVGRVSLTLLYVIAVLGGAATVTADIAKLSLVPRLVRGERLAVANSRMTMGIALGITAGPGLAGLLTGIAGAPFALIVDAATYAFCVAALLGIRRFEPVRAVRRDTRAEMLDGLRTVFGTPAIRNIAVHAAAFNAGVQLLSVAIVVYFVRDLGLDGTAYGIVLLSGGVGAVTGALAAPAVIRRIGHGPAILGTLALTVNAFWILPAVHASTFVVVVSCSAALAVGLTGSGVGGVVSVTVRQLMTPTALHARMNASYQLVNFCGLPLGALSGGVLVDAVGARGTMWVAATVLVLSITPLAARSTRSLGRVVGPPAEPTAPAPAPVATTSP